MVVARSRRWGNKELLLFNGYGDSVWEAEKL
jgi:hypothetical protein